MGHEGIGARIARKEDRRFITGAGNYTDDIPVKHAAHAVFVRSPHAHARIRRIDTARAMGAPGVIGVLTGDELVQDKVGGLICGWMIKSTDGSPMKAGPYPPLAKDIVRFVGNTVAVVVAESKNQARDAAELVEVEYEELPAVVDAAKAQASDAPQIHAEAPRNTIYQWALGDKAAVEGAFARAARIVDLDLVNNRLVPNAIEPRSATGIYDRSEGHFTLYTTSQNPHVTRLVLSVFIGLAPEHKLRVVAPDVGGGFGSKIFIYPEETVCLWASRRLGVPVRWTADRSESFMTDAHGRDHVTHAEMAFDADHMIIGLRVKTIANLGAYMSTFSSSVPTYLYATLLSGQYNIPAIYAEVDAVYTNTTPRLARYPDSTPVIDVCK